MQDTFRRFLSPNKIQRDFLCYCDSMGFDFHPDFYIDRQSYHDYLIMYTMEGLLWCHQNGKKIAVYPGEYIFLDLHQPHKYYFQEGLPTRIAWLTVNGLPAAHVVQQMQQLFPLPFKKQDEGMYEKMLAFFVLSDCPDPDIYQQSADCYAFLMQIWKDAVSAGNTLSESRIQQKFKSDVWHTIAHSLHRTISMEELAQCVSLSKFHFVRTFHQVFGTSPHQFIMAEKVRQAEYQLLNTTSTISDIAESLGFSNPSYFAKVFKRATGRSPTDFREENREAQKGLIAPQDAAKS